MVLPVLGTLVMAAGLYAAFAGDDNPLLRSIARPDLLPVLRTETVASESSYDRTGGNDDGFSGKYSFIRKEGDALVIAELTGPGVVQRLWTPTPTDEPIEFTFDGEATPRIKAPFRDLFLGSVPGFAEPLVGHGAGGFYSYVPIPYAKSLKVVYRGPVMQFFQINHATLPAGTDIPSFSADWLKANDDAFQKARTLLASTGKDLAADLAGAHPVHSATVRRKLAPGKRVALFAAKRGGRILGLRLGPADALAGKDRALVLSITFDGAKKPAVLCPVGDFFGYSWGEPAMRAVYAGTDAGTSYIYLPMPFDRSAKVELISQRTEGAPVEVEATVEWSDEARRTEEGRFYAVWRRENPTTIGKPFTFVEAEGHGHVVAAFLQAQGEKPGGTLFFEGDDQWTIDGKLAIHGTGSEDFFNGGWYDVPGRWDARRSFPLSGCLDYKKHLGRSAAYRFMVPDPVVYQKSLVLAIEHAPERNDMITDYVGVTYLYADQPPAGAGTLPPAAERAVTDPVRTAMATGWNIPVQSFSFQNATLRKHVEKVGDSEARILSLTAERGDMFGMHFIELLCDLPATGAYKLTAEAVAGPEQGAVQLYRDETPIGPKVDLRAAEREVRTVDLGRDSLREGINPVMLKLTPSTSEQKRFGLDLVTLFFERVG